MNNKDILLKTTEKTNRSLEQSRTFINTKIKIKGICNSLSKETDKYKPQKTAENIDSYLKSKNRLERILYSEISGYVFSLEIVQRGIFATNIEKLLLYSLDERNHVNEDSKKIIIKIFDHFNLALHQIENTENILSNSVEDAKQSINNEVKGMEKEYIAILGIFASIVLAFVGGITFSSSVLQNINQASIYRLLIVIDLLAAVLTNVIYLLIKFICVINEKDKKIFHIKWINAFFILFFALVVLGWLFNIKSFPLLITKYIPFLK